MTPKPKFVASAVLALVAALAILALAGVSVAGNGKGKGPAKSASSSQYQYSGGAQYGRHRVAICHKGHTIRVAQPAVKAHLRHGDHLGAC